MRSWLWRLVYLKLLLALFWWRPIAELPLLPASMAPELDAFSLDEMTVPVADPITTSVQPRTSPVSRPSPPLDPMAYLLLAWLIGLGWSACLVAAEWRAVRRLRREAVPVEDERALGLCAELSERLGVRRAPRLLRADGIESPMLMGVARPTIIVPSALLSGASHAQLRLMLTHELAHLRRDDLLWGWLPSIAQGAFFFHPLVWLANWEFRVTQEVVCDELAVLATEAAPVDYGEMLLEMANADHSGPFRSPAAVCVVESCRTLKRRLMAMKHFTHVSRKRMLIAAGALLIASALGVTPWRLVHSAAQQPAAEPAATDLGTTDPVVQGLIDKLDDEDPDVRADAVEALSKMADEAPDTAPLAPALLPLAMLWEKEELERRWPVFAASRTIAGKVADPEILTAVVTTLANELHADSLDRRLAAAEALQTVMRTGASEAVLQPALGHLIQALHDEDASMRGRAARCLGGIAMASEDGALLRPAVPMLIEILGQEERAARWGAAWALSRVASKVQDEALLTPAASPLIELLADESHAIRRQAADALEAIAPVIQDEGVLAPAIAPLIKALQMPDRRGYARQSAASALGAVAERTGDRAALEPAIAPLVSLLEEKVVYGYWLVASTLATVASKADDLEALPVAVSYLAKALQSEEENVHARRDAASALGRIAEQVDAIALEDAISPLIEALEDPDAKVRKAAAKALERIDTPEARAALQAHQQ